MFNLYKLAKRKKGVSPVIAVVLLIALTVAAAAVIWAITNNVLNTGTSTFVVDTTDASISGTTATWTGTISVSEETSITDVLIDGDVQDSTALVITIDGTGITTLNAGESSVNIDFDTSNAGVNIDSAGGTYQLSFRYTVGGGNPQISEAVSVTFS